MNIFVNIFDLKYHRASFRFTLSSTDPLSSWWRRSSWSTTPASKSILVPSSRIMWRTFLCLSLSSGLGFGLASSGQGGRSGKKYSNKHIWTFLDSVQRTLDCLTFYPLKGCWGPRPRPFIDSIQWTFCCLTFYPLEGYWGPRLQRERWSLSWTRTVSALRDGWNHFWQRLVSDWVMFDLIPFSKRNGDAVDSSYIFSAANRKAVVCPVIDVISDESFEYITASDMTWGGFNWKLNFRWWGKHWVTHCCKPCHIQT